MTSLHELEFPRGFFMDTHAAVKELIDSGMPEKQAESVVRIQARLLDQNLATKADIAALQVDLAAMKVELIRWGFGINLALMSLLLAAIKFL